MARSGKSCTILMADDDADDRLLVRDALQETGRPHHLHFVRDGEELADYLYHRGAFADGAEAPRPDLILLDLKMPKKDGCQVLRELRADPRWRRVPIVALTTSTAIDDIRASYDFGVNSYLTKPVTFRELVRMMDTLSEYWFELVELPPAD